jgi:hypothetical protein
MIRMRALFVASVLCFLIIACKKDSDPAPNNPNNPNNGTDSTDTTDPNELEAASLDSFLQSNNFQLARYYSDTAIDYDETDSVVKSETDLWSYVSPWLKDDIYTFGTDGNVTINQNDDKIPSDSTATLTRPYAVVADDEGVKFTFLTNDYMALDYRLISRSDTSLTVSAFWNGHTVKSDYKVVQ